MKGAQVLPVMGKAPGDTRPGHMAPVTLYWASQATMCISILSFFFECYAYNMIFLRRILPSAGKSSLVTPFRIIFNVLWVLALWSYHQAHWADPGAVPLRWQQFVRNVGDALPISPARPEWQPAKATLCKKCKVPRPERAHHCVLCNVCVMRMDHHCPWINNCVGVHNHKFFILLAVYAWLASLMAIGSSLPELWRLAGIALHLQDRSLVTGADSLDMWEIWAFMVYGFFAFMIGLLLTSLLATHVPLALRNLTTIEDFYENMPNPFEMGSKMGNLTQVFGNWGLDWFIPVRPLRPLSDGVVYPPLDGLHMEDLYSSGRHDRLENGDSIVDEAKRLNGESINIPLLYKEGKDAEIDRLWKVRYKVRSLEEMKAKDADKLSPFMAQFWACGRGSARERTGTG